MWDSSGYVYDGVGNITAIGTSTYGYDALSRLTSASLPGHSENYTYDPFGNMTQRTTDSVTLPTPMDANNHLSGLVYDTAGNLTQSGAEQYLYDPFSNMREKDANSTAELYVYDANDERIGVRSGPDHWLWSLRDENGQVLRQYESFQSNPGLGWTWVEDYVYRDGALLGAERVPEEGGRRHFHLDHLGTPRLITGTSGQIVASHDYFPFGNELPGLMTQETSQGFSREEPMKFTGHERDFTSGTAFENTNYFDYMHARHGNPGFGRFLSVDPMLDLDMTLTNPQGWNRYTYALNNPMRYSDPTGLKPCKIKLSGGDAKAAGVADGTEVDGECVEATDPKTTPMQLGWEWLSGTGPRDRHFTNGDDMTEMLKQHEHVQDVAREVCGGSRPPEGRANYGLSGFGGVPKYLRDYSTLTTGGATGNLAVTYLGSYKLQYSLAGANDVRMTVTNSSTAASGFRPPVLGYTAGWNKYVGGR